MEHEFPFGTFRPGKQDYLSDVNVPFLSEIFHWNDPKKLCAIYFATGFSGKLFATPAGFWPRGQNPRRQKRSPRVIMGNFCIPDEIST